MAIKTKTSLTSTNNLNITDPLNQQNTAARVREVTQDLIDSSLNFLDAQTESLKISANSSNNTGLRTFVAGSTNGTIGSSSNTSVILGSEDCTITAQDNTAIIASDTSTVNADTSAAIASTGCDVTGINSIVSGSSNDLNSANSFLTGTGNTVTGSSSITTGKNVNNTATYSIAAGKDTSCNYEASIATGNGTPGQTVVTSATVPLYATSVGITATNFNIPIILTDDTAMRFTFTVVATDVATGDSIEIEVFGLCKNIGGTVSIVGTPVPVTVFTDASVSTANVVVTAVANELKLETSGVLALSMVWGGTFQYTSITF